MPLAKIESRVAAGGTTIHKTWNRTANTAQAFEATLPVGEAGELTQRTSGSVAEFQLAPGHGITTGESVDVYWSGGVRFGCTVGTVSGITVPVTGGGAGDDFPIVGTDVVVSEQEEFDFFLDGDAGKLVAVIMADGVAGSGAGHLEFTRLNGTLVGELDLVANIPQVFDLAAGIANPFSGAFIWKLFASNGSLTAAATLTIIQVVENT